MSSRFIQLHTLTSYAASLLNRDDAGFSKRIAFGGAVRTRVSSQCLKRHWRVFDGEHSLQDLKAPESIRSRIAFERFVVEPLVASGMSEPVVRAVTERLVAKVLGKADKPEDTGDKKKSKKKAEAAESSGPIATAQVTVLGKPELDYLRSIVAEISKSGSTADAALEALEKKLKDTKALAQNLRALNPGSLEAGLGAALFGRMVTGDVLARTDAAIHVAHALSVHAQNTESDYFSAMDDLLREDGEQGSAHINASELTSGLFYGYVVIDVEGLVENLGDRNLAGDVVERLVHMVATVSPGAKLGSTAPYAWSHLVLAEAGRAQPRTLANAFLEPVSTRGNVVTNAYQSLAAHLSELDQMYGRPESELQKLAGLGARDLFKIPAEPLIDVARWARARVLA